MLIEENEYRNVDIVTVNMNSTNIQLLRSLLLDIYNGLYFEWLQLSSGYFPNRGYVK